MNGELVRYVNTFIFDESALAVLLIKKQRPEHQRGRYNGIGGKIEPGETPSQAALREIREECGLALTVAEVVPFCRYVTSRSDIAFFAAFIRHHRFVRASTITDEEIVVVSPAAIGTLPAAAIMPNLRWQIPMALNALEPGSDGKLHRFEIIDQEVSR